MRRHGHGRRFSPLPEKSRIFIAPRCASVLCEPKSLSNGDSFCDWNTKLIPIAGIPAIPSKLTVKITGEWRCAIVVHWDQGHKQWSEISEKTQGLVHTRPVWCANKIIPFCRTFSFFPQFEGKNENLHQYLVRTNSGSNAFQPSSLLCSVWKCQFTPF